MKLDAMVMQGKIRKRALLKKRLKYSCSLYFFVLPAIIWYFVFKYIPLYGITIAFKKFSYSKGILGSDWVGLIYFKQFIESTQFKSLVYNTVLISGLKLLVCFPCPIILALMINEIQNIRYKRIVQTVSYLPHFVSWVVIIALLTKFVSPNNGIINDVRAGLFGAEPVYYMGEINWFYIFVVFTNVYKTIGWNSIIYLAAIAGVDINLYEAARIDGANRLRCIVSITLPSILPTIIIMFIMNVGSLMSAGFDQIYLMQNPANITVSETLDTHIVKAGIQQGKFSYSTAVGIFQSAFAFLLVVMTNQVCKKTSEISLW